MQEQSQISNRSDQALGCTCLALCSGLPIACLLYHVKAHLLFIHLAAKAGLKKSQQNNSFTIKSLVVLVFVGLVVVVVLFLFSWKRGQEYYLLFVDLAWSLDKP